MEERQLPTRFSGFSDGLLPVAAAPTVQRRPTAPRRQQLQLMGSTARAQGLRAHGRGCAMARWAALDQGLNPCPLHWQAVSLPLSHQGGPFPSTLKGSWPRVLAGGESGHT